MIFSLRFYILKGIVIIMAKIMVKEVPIEEAMKVDRKIAEFGGQCSKAFFERRYEGKERLILLATLDGKGAGYMISYDRYGDGSLYCWLAGVDPEFRRRGILTAMMEYQESWARKRGYEKIKIKTKNSRREMLSYLVKCGFNFIEVAKKPKIEENRIILEKSI